MTYLCVTHVKMFMCLVWYFTARRTLQAEDGLVAYQPSTSQGDVPGSLDAEDTAAELLQSLQVNSVSVHDDMHLKVLLYIHPHIQVENVATGVIVPA